MSKLTSNPSSELRASEWKAMMHRYETRGQTDTEFCLREGISVATFYYRRNRLQESSTALASTVPVSDFIDAGPLAAEVQARAEIRIDLGGGVVVHVVRG